MNLAELLEELDAFGGPIPLEHMTRRVRKLKVERADVRRFTRFGDTCYQRNLMHEGPAYQALVLCWRSGQRSPIHDHSGSACVVRVIEGTGTETLFDLSASGLIYPTSTRRWRAGDCMGSFDADIHQMGNLEAARQDLVTLHLYSPPLLAMRTYFLGDSVIGECDNAIRAAIRARANYLGRAAAQPDAGPRWSLPKTVGATRSRRRGVRLATKA
jgi:cysteine dioxygenase